MVDLYDNKLILQEKMNYVCQNKVSLFAVVRLGITHNFGVRQNMEVIN